MRYWLRMCIAYRRAVRARRRAEREELPRGGMVGVVIGVPLALALWGAIALALWL
jgi:hypothetical protein